ncbi:MAG TPA: DUF4157 domain-containing protein [Silvibacterium sp.]|nr:DUF4157 domain-containing protein [Silvibacterium sp.]
MSTFSEAPHQVKGEVSSAGYRGELTATGSPRFGFDFGLLSILPLPPTVIQTKLAINTPGDEYEQEADQVSEKVMRMSEPRLQRKCACEGTCADCQKEQSGEEHQRLQLKPVGTSGAGQTQAPPMVHDVLRSPGQPLDAATRAFMEPRFGHDFSRVRVHSGAAAEQSARDVNAHAYTAGHNIVFAAGRFAPQTHDGRRLIAHELSHVVQQKGAHDLKILQRNGPGGSKDPPISATPDDPAEMWKDVIAQRHFQESEGNVTFARMKILDANGRAVVNFLTQSDKREHAEEKAIRVARTQVEQKLFGGKIIFVTDQTVCPHPERCHTQIAKFAQELGVEEATVTVFMRPARPGEEKGTVKETGLPQHVEETLATPKATAKKVQKRVVEGLELYSATETVYTRGRASGEITTGGGPTGKTASGGGGGTLAPVKPPAQTASGEITTGGKPTGKTGSGGGGGTLAPVQPPAQTASGEITTAPSSVAKPAGSVPLEGPPAATSRDLAVEVLQTETTNRRMASAARFGRYALEAYSFLGVLEQIAGALNLAAATLAGGPLQKEKQQAIATVATATELADYYESLDLRKQIPSGGWAAWDGGWYALQQIQFSYYETESHLHNALESVDAALRNIGRQIRDLADAATEKTAALVLTPVSTPYADAYLFADAAGQLRSHLIDAANAYARAHHAIYFSQRMTQASIKYMEIRLRQLGVTGLVGLDIDTEDLRTAPLDKFSERQ